MASRRAMGFQTLPLAAMVAVAAVATFVIFGDSAAPPAAPLAKSAALVFQSQADGSVRVLSASSGAELGHYAATGFVWGLVRSLERERRRFGIEPGEPYLLGLNDEARLTLRDPALDRDLVFDAFGSSNRKVFESLLSNSQG
jgi:putative photosynthetic complex assembly protein